MLPDRRCYREDRIRAANVQRYRSGGAEQAFRRLRPRGVRGRTNSPENVQLKGWASNRFQLSDLAPEHTAGSHVERAKQMAHATPNVLELAPDGAVSCPAIHGAAGESCIGFSSRQTIRASLGDLGTAGRYGLLFGRSQGQGCEAIAERGEGAALYC